MGQAFTHCCACGFRPLDGNGQQWSTVLASKRQQNELCFSAQKTWKRRTKRNATVELTVRGYKLLNSAVDGTTPTTVPGQHGDVGTDKLRLVTVKSDHLAVVWMLFVGLWRTNLVSSRTNFYHPSVPHRPPYLCIHLLSILFNVQQRAIFILTWKRLSMIRKVEIACSSDADCSKIRRWQKAPVAVRLGCSLGKHRCNGFYGLVH